MKGFIERPMLFTSHRVQMQKKAKRISAIPAEELTPAQKRFLADLKQEETPIMTSHDVQEMKREARIAVKVDVKEARVPEPAEVAPPRPSEMKKDPAKKAKNVKKKK